LKTISAAKLAQVLDVVPVEIEQFIQEGMPHKNGRFSPAHCLVWYIRHVRALLDRSSAGPKNSDQEVLHAARQRLVSIQADHAEHEFKVTSGEYLEGDALELLVLNRLRVVRENVMGIAARYGYRLVGCTEEEILSKLVKASEEVLSSLRGSAVDAYLESRSKNGGQIPAAT
jgi:phage terminase Nu1 subunit (DNA packaging protein)